MPPPQQLRLREIRSGDIVDKISLGHRDFQPLKTFLRVEAKRLHKINISKTYVLVPVSGSSRVWGYISLTNSQITLDGEQAPEDCRDAACRYDSLPAIKIARMAVDKALRGQGYGRDLVGLATSIAQTDVMPNVGCRFLITDAKQKSVKFYEKTGFTMLDTKINKESEHPLMFIDLHKLDN